MKFQPTSDYQTRNTCLPTNLSVLVFAFVITEAVRDGTDTVLDPGVSSLLGGWVVLNRAYPPFVWHARTSCSDSHPKGGLLCLLTQGTAT
jgi:hypothetical protein